MKLLTVDQTHHLDNLMQIRRHLVEASTRCFPLPECGEDVRKSIAEIEKKIDVLIGRVIFPTE